jgi:NDP-sugar pyrophosphorylase family protein
MKAMIFAAGRGERLKPLTNHTPKALVELNGIPLIERVIQKLIKHGISEIIINVHYLAEQIIDFLESKNNFGIRIEISDETDLLLDTGGGLKKASWFFDDQVPFILYNTDIISNIDINQMFEQHTSGNVIATLAVRNRISSRYFLFNDDNELCGWKNTKTHQEIIRTKSDQLYPYAFSGVHIVSPEIFNHLPTEECYSIVNTYLKLSKKFKILAYLHNSNYWFDIGDSVKLKEAEEYIT